MRFAELFATQTPPVISFEVYPPKTEKAFANLHAALPRLVSLRPTFMTVTYGALGSTRTQTLDVVSLIRSEHGLVTASHLTCVGSTREDIDAYLDKAQEAGAQNVIALRGDPPQGEERFVPVQGGFGHANELVAHIRSRNDFGIAVAGYPEKHIEAPDLDTDLRYLKLKVDAGADIVITQLFYDNADFFTFTERARELGVDVPIVPGLLPIQSEKQLQRITAMCGAKVPAKLRERLKEADGDAVQVRALGVEWCADQCRELLERGVPGVHFYVLNSAEHMERIFSRLTASGALSTKE